MDFTYIKFGIGIALIAILFGGLLGLSFGCCEHDIKNILKSNAQKVLIDQYGGDPDKAKKVYNKSWVYFKRAHLHSQTMGVIAIVIALLCAWLNFPSKFQISISILSGVGSLGYGMFWLISGYLAPVMGSTGSAKESVAFLAQLSGASFFIASASTFVLLAKKIFLEKNQQGFEIKT